MGQHYHVRLNAPDGYQAQRIYSIASAPVQMGEIDLTVERLEDGEISSYLADVLVVGDQLEVRGSMGGYFVWEVAQDGPLLLISGGSGIVPLMAMLRHRSAAGATVPTRTPPLAAVKQSLTIGRLGQEVTPDHVQLV